VSALARTLAPFVLIALLLAAWEIACRALAVPVYFLPPPSAVARALASDWPGLLRSAWNTLSMALIALVAASLVAQAVALVVGLSPILERAVRPLAVVLQVTPVVAIAPLILIWVGFERINTALVLIAALVAFFPILSNTTLGLKSADFNLTELMRLYGASRWQILWRLQLPTALPYLLGACRIAGGLALIGAVVAEFVAGSGTATGLAWRIIEAGNRLQIATMFAALALLALLGLAIFAALSGLEYLLLRRWHESALKRPL
jgi:NitT/TauT family transport system permease protein